MTTLMAHRLALVITPEHIVRGVPGDPLECAAAGAFVDAGYPGVSVGMEYAHPPTCDAFGKEHDETCIRLPDELRRWIALFDSSEEPVYPERFVLDLPESWP